VEFSLDLADRVYILEKGEIRYTGTAAQLRDNDAVRHQYLAL
jgi:branched-chain amino acid transport system ATP-binding protein